MSENRKLDFLAVAAMLISSHYGLGFLLGTGEKALTQGVAGSLYAASTSLGILALLGLAKFYWTQIQPIWTLLGDRFGSEIKFIICLTSWVGATGAAASQILGGAFIFQVLGIPIFLSILIITLLIAVVSLLPLEKVGKLFQALLLISSLALVYSCHSVGGWLEYGRSLFEFIPALNKIPSGQLIAIPLVNILVTALGMDFQQYIVQAKNIRQAYLGSLLAALILLLLAFVPSAVVTAAARQGIFPASLETKAAIPYILAWAGGGTYAPIGIGLILTLLVTALGSSSGILRIANATIFDLTKLPKSPVYQVFVTLANTALALIIALTGGAIVNLIVSFDAIYASAILIPFIAYLLDKTKRYSFAASTVQLSLALGSMAAIATLIASRIFPSFAIFDSSELTIFLGGISFSALGLTIGKIIEKFAAVDRIAEETL